MSDVTVTGDGLTRRPGFSPSSLYSWSVVVFLMVLYTSSFIDRQILSLLVKPIRADLGISDTQYSYLTGFAFVTMYSIAGIPLGWMVDRWSRRGVISAGVVAWSLMTAGCGLASSFGSLFATRIGVGIGEATLSPASYSLVSDYFPPSKLSRALSVYALGIPIGTGLALVVGGRVIKALEAVGIMDLPLLGMTKPWQAVFLTIGLPGLLLGVLTLLIVREPPRQTMSAEGVVEHPPTVAAAAAYLWENRRLYSALFFGMGFLAMFSYAANAWYPAFLQRVHGFSVADAGLFLGVSTLVFGVFGSVGAGVLADALIARGRPDGHFLVPIGYGLGLAICGVGAGIAPIPWLSLAFVALTGFFSNTMLGCVVAALQIATPKRMRGQISASFLFTAAFIGLGFGPTAVAVSTDHIFGYDEAVGYSLALVALIFPALGCIALHVGRKPILERARKVGSEQLPKWRPQIPREDV